MCVPTSKAVPYTVRVQRPGGGKRLHADLENQAVNCNTQPMSLRTAIRDLVSQLPPGWQATKLLGYVILYKETARLYPDAEVIAYT